jgi:hypothetical protein
VQGRAWGGCAASPWEANAQATLVLPTTVHVRRKPSRPALDGVGMVVRWTPVAGQTLLPGMAAGWEGGAVRGSESNLNLEPRQHGQHLRRSRRPHASRRRKVRR